MNRRIAFFKMIKSGLHGRVVNTLRNLYTKTFFRVKHNGMLSEKIIQLVGVNQGGNSSPIIFRKYLIDLKDYMETHTGVVLSEQEILAHLLWADDLIAVSSKPSDAQKQLNGLAKYCSKNRSIVNTIKTKYMTFGNVGDIRLTFNGKNLEKVTDYKYLGNIHNSISRSISDPFSLNYDYLCGKARRNIFSLMSKTKHLYPLPPKIRIYLFDSTIRPVLLYGSAVWGVSNIGRDKIDKVHLWYMRMVLSIKRNSSNLITLGDSGSLPPSVNAIINCLYFLKRLQGMPKHSLVFKAFSESKRLHEIGFDSWYGRVMKLAENNNVDLSIHNKSQIKTNVIACFIESWKSQVHDIANNPLLRTYVHIKENFQLEPFLSLVKDVKYRNAIARFRASSHHLEIERGRHTNPITPFDKRKCWFCDSIETEIHFMTECSFYSSERICLYQQISTRFPGFSFLNNFEKFKFMFTFGDDFVLTLMGKFIHNCLEKRNLIGRGVVVLS